MEILNRILASDCMQVIYYLSFFIVAFQLAEGFTWKWKWVYKLRKRNKFWDQEPFNCTPCLSFWLAMMNTNIWFPQFWVYNIFFCLIFYIMVRYRIIR